MPAILRRRRLPFLYPPGGPVTPWYLTGGVALANCLGAYRAKGAADLATSYINLAHPGTNDAAPGLAPTFNAATGWTFDGATTYLATGIEPQANWSVFVQFSDCAVGAVIGARDGGDDGIFLVPNSGVASHYYSYGTRPSIAGAVASGNIGVAGTGCYLNGVWETACNADGATIYDFYLGGMNSAGVASYCACKIQAVAIYDVIHPAPDLIAAAMAAL